MCEDLQAEPLFVINCGMSHRENVPMDQMGEFVQDALDAIEYCNGPVDSRWGRRAGQGRPPRAVQPEVHGDRQRERRAGLPGALRPVLRRHQGQVSGHHADRRRADGQRPAEIVDEHYYSSPEFFIQQAAPLRHVRARRGRRSTSASTP